MKNSMTVFFASVLSWKYAFWASLVQKMKIVSFSWSLIHSLTQIWRTQWWFIFKWLSVRLRTKWLWVRIPLLALKLKISRLLQARSSLTFRQIIECGFTLKLVRDLIITYSLLTSALWNSCLRCSRPQMFLKIGVLKNFVIFTGKYLCWSLFLIQLTPKTPKRL